MSYRFFPVFLGTISLLLFSGSGCGYGFQNAKNPLFTKEGVQKIYVDPILNNSYKAGVENIVYNSLVRTLAAHGRVTLVKNRESADAWLQGSVQGAGYIPSAATSVSGLNPVGLGATLATGAFPVSSEYTATLSCSFSLVRRVTPLKPGEKYIDPATPRGKIVAVKKSMIWSSTFSRSKPYPAANQLDVPGTTSALINDSELDRALLEIARNMMEDVHESMLAMF